MRGRRWPNLPTKRLKRPLGKEVFGADGCAGAKPEADERLDLQPEEAGIAAIQGTDPGMLMQMQGVAAGSLLGAKSLPTEGGGQGFLGIWISHMTVWLLKQLRWTGLAMSGRALAASALSLGRPVGTRATAALAQRGEL